MINIKINLGEIIKEMREAKGYSQERLAELSNLDRTYISLIEREQRNPTVLSLAAIAKALDTTVSDLTKELEISPKELSSPYEDDDYKYIENKNHYISIDDQVTLDNGQVLDAINLTNKNLKDLHMMTAKSGIQVFEALGLRNLSGFVGEYFVSSLAIISNDDLQMNPHQDGYPDLLLLQSKESKDYFKSVVTIKNDRLYPKEKHLFSPYKYGGVEVKATVGSTPPARKVPKPLIGESRIELLESFDWKAHHRETNNLVGILWDFIDEIPVICAVFYSDNLSEKDWGKIVQPKKGGGRTTSVSIMNTKGIKKMARNWLFVIDDQRYTEKLSDKRWIGKDVSKNKKQ